MPDRPITIAPFTLADTAGIIDLIVPVQRNEFALPITAANQPDLAQIPSFYQHGAARPA